MLLFIFGCSDNNIDGEINFYNNVASTNDLFTRSQSNNSDNVIFSRLEEINDSVAALSFSEIAPMSLSDEWDFIGVCASDVKGFMDGVRYGWDVGKGFGKFANAALYGVIYAAAYSLFLRDNR